jgi:hypothetical protein
MEYKGKEIGKPTLEMVQEYINRERFTFPAKIAYNFFEKELWQTKKGQPYQSLEVALNIYNGIYLQRQRRNSGFVGSLF